jgi:hypothetical protein
VKRHRDDGVVDSSALARRKPLEVELAGDVVGVADVVSRRDRRGESQREDDDRREGDGVLSALRQENPSLAVRALEAAPSRPG